MKPSCINCLSADACRESALSWAYLFIGLVATLAIRLVNVFMNFSPFWAKVSWYIGIVGFFIYFLYKFRQSRSLERRLKMSGLIKRVSENQQLTSHDYAALKGILCQSRSKSDAINYFFIFFTSGIALLLAVYQDFIVK
jgi:hypothetical protein